MYTHDYSDELHVKRADKQVPIGVAVILFIACTAGAWFGYHAVKAHLLAQEQEMQAK